jgi:hypothetical protein
MLIRYGHEITLTYVQPTASVCLLSVHDNVTADIRVPEMFFTSPAVSMYHSVAGNHCRRLAAPMGDLTIRADRQPANGHMLAQGTGREAQGQAGHPQDAIRRPAAEPVAHQPVRIPSVLI